MQFTSAVLALVATNGLFAAAVAPAGYGMTSSTSTCSWKTSSTCTPVFTISMKTLSKPVTTTRTVTAYSTMTVTTVTESTYNPVSTVTFTATTTEVGLETQTVTSVVTTSTVICSTIPQYITTS